MLKLTGTSLVTNFTHHTIFQLVRKLTGCITSSTDVIQLTLTLKMTTTQVVETSVTVNNNSPIHNYVHPDDQTQTTFVVLMLCLLLNPQS